MKRLPEKPTYADVQDKKETRTFFGIMFGGAAIAFWLLESIEVDPIAIKRIFQGAISIGSMFFANEVKKKMEREHAEKVRVWLNFWDEYEEETKKLEKAMRVEEDEYEKETMRLKIESRKAYYEKNYY